MDPIKKCFIGKKTHYLNAPLFPPCAQMSNFARFSPASTRLCVIYQSGNLLHETEESFFVYMAA